MTDGPGPGAGPVFIVGLPRSGSTLLSRWINEGGDVVVFNDLYYLQAVFGEGAERGPLDAATAERLLQALLEVIRRYADNDDALVAKLPLATADIDAIEQGVRKTSRDRPLDWAALMDETLGRVARALGATRWADKTPQNFLHVDRLRRAFPAARFLYLVRDPRCVLASYKHVDGRGHDRRRYHVVPYALYWRAMARSYLAQRAQPHVAVVRYEHLLENPAPAAAELGTFLGAAVPAIDLATVGTNSSFRRGEQAGMTPTEQWLCERICGPEMSALGYEPDGARPRFGDAGGLVVGSARFLTFQLRQALRSRDRRRRMAAVGKRALPVRSSRASA